MTPATTLIPFRLAPPPTPNATDARLCAALAAMCAWADDHGDRPSFDREELWHGYRIAHELLGAFCAVDASAFGGGR